MILLWRISYSFAENICNYSGVAKVIVKRESYSTTALSEDSAAERHSTSFGKGRRFDSCTSPLQLNNNPIRKNIKNLPITPLTRGGGTGKTYLAAFDIKAIHPKRMLFVVHRRSIAIKAMEPLKQLLKINLWDYFQVIIEI